MYNVVQFLSTVFFYLQLLSTVCIYSFLPTVFIDSFYIQFLPTVLLSAVFYLQLLTSGLSTVFSILSQLYLNIAITFEYLGEIEPL